MTTTPRTEITKDASKPEQISSADVIRKHKEYIWPAVSNYYQQPLVADRGSMQYLWDLDGRKYLDFFGGILTISVGHANPKVTGEIKEQVDRLQHTSTLYPNEQIVALAEKLAQITPGHLQKSYFTNSGTEANEMAILLARMSTGSFDVVALRHGYSGGSTIARSMTGQAPWRKAGVVSVGFSHAINPYCYRCPLGMKYPDCNVACANDVESLIQTGTSGQIAAFIAEPIQGVGGFITPPPEYFKMVFKIVKKYGGLFIADEVQTGFRPHWQEMVRHRAVGSHAGHHHLREGHGEWRAHRRDHHHCGTREFISGFDDFNLWRQSRHFRRRARHDSIHRRGKSFGERAHRRKVFP